MELVKEYLCMYCFQKNSLVIEVSYCSQTIDIIEDCFICCNPLSISYTIENEEVNYFEVCKAD